MEEAILEYLGRYDSTPQYVWSIVADLELQTDDPKKAPARDVVQATLDEMVADRKIRAVDGGVDGAGNKQVRYAVIEHKD